MCSIVWPTCRIFSGSRRRLLWNVWPAGSLVGRHPTEKPTAQDKGEQSSKDQARDVGFPRHVRGRIYSELQDEPDPDEERSRYGNEEETEQAENSMPGEQHNISPHHSGDGSGSADQRDCRVGIQKI